MQKRAINPMPESLDDNVVGPNTVLGPAQTTIGQGFVGGQPRQETFTPPQYPTSQQRTQINNKVDDILTTEMMNKEILDEKIRQDIASVKSSPSIELENTPQDILKSLIARGEYREDKELFGHIWTLRALNQRDILLAFNDIKGDMESVAVRVTSVMISQIVYAIEALDGTSVYEWFTDIIKRSDFSTTEEYKIAVRRTLRRYLEEMPPDFISKLDIAYTQIEKTRNEALLELKKS